MTCYTSLLHPDGRWVLLFCDFHSLWSHRRISSLWQSFPLACTLLCQTHRQVEPSGCLSCAALGCPFLHVLIFSTANPEYSLVHFGNRKNRELCCFTSLEFLNSASFLVGKLSFCDSSSWVCHCGLSAFSFGNRPERKEDLRNSREETLETLFLEGNG